MTAWLTTAAAAKHAGVSVRTIREWAEAGRLTGVKTTPGSVKAPWRFRVADVDRCLESGRVTAA